MQLVAIAEKVGKKLKERGWYLATAESFTGGGISYYLTAIPGSSTWFERGFVTYSNQAKKEMLGVNAFTLEKVSAVSFDVAKEMAEGALKRSQATISIATTGIAGPDGATPQKPIGQAFIAFASQYFPTQVESCIFRGSRAEIREQAIYFSLEKLLKCLDEKN